MNEKVLREKVLELIKATEAGLSISQLEARLQEAGLHFRRDDLRSVVWRMAAAHVLRITPESRIVADAGAAVG
jgi:hypothetical protein